MIHTTLNLIRRALSSMAAREAGRPDPGKGGAADETLQPFISILDRDGLDAALRHCETAPQYATLWHHYAIDCAEMIRHQSTDARSLQALVVARRYAKGEATDAELDAARRAAEEAAVTTCEGSRFAWLAAHVANRNWIATGEVAWMAGIPTFHAATNYTREACLRGFASALTYVKDCEAMEERLSDRFRELVTAGVWTPMQPEATAS